MPYPAQNCRTGLDKLNQNRNLARTLKLNAILKKEPETPSRFYRQLRKLEVILPSV